ncbi:MAG: AAA family ATPase [Anaerolineales bacterium]|nr:AAA family ATPase [Anaerolineales bacterium]
MKLDQAPISSLGSRKAEALLVYLAVQGRAIAREVLAELLWPERSQGQTLGNLRRVLYDLRRHVGDYLTISRDSVAIVPERIWLDADALGAALRDISDSSSFHSPSELAQVETALTFYKGPFLQGFNAGDSAGFDNWLVRERERWQQRVGDTLEQLGAWYLDHGPYSSGLRSVRQLLQLDPYREATVRQLLRLLIYNGQRAEALAQFETSRELLWQELGVEPATETLTLYEQILADELVTPDLPVNNSEAPVHNLPRLLTTFIGREKELVDIADLISSHRLVVLTGVGGIGKTTLSIQVGHRLLADFADGVWLIELAQVSNPDYVAETIAYALGLRDSGDQPVIERLLSHLQQKSGLLILDNCEHLIHTAARFVETLLQRCPGLKILATSREAFTIPGERLYQVPPLSLPSRQQSSSLTLANWAQYEALTLFVDRVAAMIPDFQLDEDNVRPLVHICQQLDGLPLAIELAAARVRVLTVAQIANRLDERFQLLTSGRRTALPRQQTLRASIEWSWSLLTATEQHLLQRLSVFAGGMSLAAVEAVCADEMLDRFELLDLMDELVKKSLVVAERQPGLEKRYHLLIIIRQFAQEKLAEAGRQALMQDRHLAYFLQMAEQAGEALIGPDQVAWRTHLERELDNIRAALNWAQHTNREAGLKLTIAIWRFWRDGYLREGNSYLAHFLADEKGISLPLKARALWVWSQISYHLGVGGRPHSLISESLALYRDLGDQTGIAWTLSVMAQLRGNIALGQAEGLAFLDESLTIFQTLGDRLGIAGVLLNRATYARERNDYDQALVYAKDSASLLREMGDLASLADALSWAADAAIIAGDFVSAEAMLHESLAIQKSLGPRPTGIGLCDFGRFYFARGDYEKASHYLEKGIALLQQVGELHYGNWAAAHLGHVLLQLGKTGKAKSLLIEAQQAFYKTGVKIGVVFALEGLASLAVRQAQLEKALTIIAWGDSARALLENPRPPQEQKAVDQELAIIRERIGENQFAIVYAAGQGIDLEDAVALALSGRDLSERQSISP